MGVGLAGGRVYGPDRAGRIAGRELRRPAWRTLHLAVDAKVGMIIAANTSPQKPSS